MEIQRVMLCHDAPLYSLTMLHTHNSHFPHPSTTMKLALTLERAAADAGRTRWGWREGKGKVGGSNTGRSKQGSAKDKQRVIGVKLCKTQSLKPFNTLHAPPPPPRPAGVTSASAPKGVKRCSPRTRMGQYPFPFNSISYPHWLFDSLMDVLTHPPPPS